MRFVSFLSLLFLVSAGVPAILSGDAPAYAMQARQSGQSTQSDAAIRERIVRESIASYPGNCPCPYNTDRAGRRCGRRSAYSRPGGSAPFCYASDVTRADVEEYRSRHRR